MAIFNSLGSNYNLEFVFKALFSSGNSKDSENLKGLLKARYGGEPFLFYKGREAITFALKILNLPKKSLIAINGFTCVAVFNSIRKAGYEPLCLDLEKEGNLNFSADTLLAALKKNDNIKAVVVQNTLGYPCDIESIRKVRDKHNLILIEDLAHCVGARYKTGDEAGTVGDFVILSFSQDKIIDAVSGGALVVRNKKYHDDASRYVNTIHSGSLSAKLRFKDRVYPFETYKIRAAYESLVGKPYHFFLRTINLLSDIMNPSLYEYYSLPNWHSKLALYQYKNLENQLNHRRSIANIYKKHLLKSILFDQIIKTIDLSSNLRFPILVSNRQDLINYLRRNGVYVSDIWYDDVAPECPVAVKISKQILNLPTHINVSEKDARRICDLINSWLRSKPGVDA